MKEDPSGKYLISAGVRRSTSSTSQWNGYVVKLNSATGALIWEFDYKTSSGQRSGFETVHFTEDGGFIVGGYANMAGNEWQGFKSGGQVEDGRPIMHKFSKATADANSLSSAPTPVWSYKCRASGNACTNNNGSVKNMRVYKEKGVEKVNEPETCNFTINGRFQRALFNVQFSGYRVADTANRFTRLGCIQWQ